MSIYTALRAGVSGLTANSSALAVISDNIANVNTVGYKSARMDFEDLLYTTVGTAAGASFEVLPRTSLPAAG